jgi:hypothetical protein
MHSGTSPLAWTTGLLVILLAACGRGNSQAAPPPPVGIGERAEYADVGLSVNSALQQQQIGEFFKAAPGNVYVVVNVTIQNKRPYQIPYKPYDFTIKDAAGTVYEAGVTAGPSVLQRSTLDATKDVSGNVNFEIPTSAQGLALSYQVPGTTGAITVRLGDAPTIPTPVPTMTPNPTATITPVPTPAPPTPTVEGGAPPSPAPPSGPGSGNGGGGGGQGAAPAP